MSNLAKQRKIQLTNHCDKALLILKSKGVNDNDFIRQAVEEKLYKDFRKILKSIEDKKNKLPF
jgi:hypothetical protein